MRRVVLGSDGDAWNGSEQIAKLQRNRTNAKRRRARFMELLPPDAPRAAIRKHCLNLLRRQKHGSCKQQHSEHSDRDAHTRSPSERRDRKD
jgi:hypothetical protein